MEESIHKLLKKTIVTYQIAEATKWDAIQWLELNMLRDKEAIKVFKEST